MKTIFFLSLLSLGICCKRPMGPADTPGKLKKTMVVFLQKSLNKDSSSIKFDVQDVNYFEDTGFYECEFKVRMIRSNFDTTGIMRARVSKDFTAVTRKW